jgi:hypothetical protein
MPFVIRADLLISLLTSGLPHHIHIEHYGQPTVTGMDMMSGDSVWRRCHPILASFVGDYPEQVLVMCTHNNRCPKCLVPPDKLGSYARYPLCDCNQARDAYLLADGDAYVFHAACREAGQKPVFHPFWESLPLSDIFVSITPDILHQLLQGVLKHMVSWLIGTFGAAQIDARCRLLLPVTDLQGPPSEHTQTEKLRDLKKLAQHYTHDRGSCDDTQISYMEFLEMEAEDDLTLARMLAG